MTAAFKELIQTLAPDQVEEGLRAMTTALANSTAFESLRNLVLADQRLVSTLLLFEPDDQEERNGMFVCLYMLDRETLLPATDHIIEQFEMAVSKEDVDGCDHSTYVSDAVSALLVIGGEEIEQIVSDYLLTETDSELVEEILSRMSKLRRKLMEDTEQVLNSPQGTEAG